MRAATGRGRARGAAVRALAILAVAAFAASGCTAGGDDEDGGQPAPGDGGEGGELPLIYQEAVEQGVEDEIDWGDTCDTERGRLKVPIVSAAPCIEPWEEGADNGGATAQGVTADEIVIALYKGQPDPLQSAIVEGAGADTDPELVHQTAIDYLRMFEDLYETYGRKLRIETIEATGGPADSTAAVADAQKVIDLKPFAAIGGPGQTPAYWQAVVDAGILCVGGCSVAEPWDAVEDAAPYLWPTAHAPEQADAHLVELIGKQLAGEPVSFAGDESLNGQERVFGWVQAETEAGEYAERVEAATARLEEEYGVEFATTTSYIYDPANAAQIATTTVQRLKQAGVTTVVLSTDPLVPADISKEATKQGYFPEWVLGPSVLMDTTIFGRRMDQEQWSHMIGISLPAARGEREIGDSYRVYEWYYGKEPPVNSQAVIIPGPAQLMLGIHLAGPNLTPETFRDGLFRYPPNEPGLTYTYVSWGEDLWDRPDYNAADDAGALWWDPQAEGEDEAGNPGVGMLRYVNGGERYLPGEWPEEPLPFFEEEGSVTVYDERPDAAPDYPAWPGSPAASG